MDRAGRSQGSDGGNYYFLWSVERVGMLYGRKTIGDGNGIRGAPRIWWTRQQGDGRLAEGYVSEPPTDTCFALLFLKRANLAKDLTTKLQFLTQVKKP